MSAAKVKDILLEYVSKDIKMLQSMQSDMNTVVDMVSNSDRSVQCLCEHLDRLLMHGLREPEQGYWPLGRYFTRSEVVHTVNTLKEVQMDVGRGRAWLYVALNEQSMESYIRMFLENQDVCKQFYLADAFIRDVERLIILQTLVSGLDFISFDLSINCDYLDHGPTEPSSRLGISRTDELTPDIEPSFLATATTLHPTPIEDIQSTSVPEEPVTTSEQAPTATFMDRMYAEATNEESELVIRKQKKTKRKKKKRSKVHTLDISEEIDGSPTNPSDLTERPPDITALSKELINNVDDGPTILINEDPTNQGPADSDAVTQGHIGTTVLSEGSKDTTDLNEERTDLKKGCTNPFDLNDGLTVTADIDEGPTDTPGSTKELLDKEPTIPVVDLKEGPMDIADITTGLADADPLGKRPTESPDTSKGPMDTADLSEEGPTNPADLSEEGPTNPADLHKQPPGMADLDEGPSDTTDGPADTADPSEGPINPADLPSATDDSVVTSLGSGQGSSPRKPFQIPIANKPMVITEADKRAADVSIDENTRLVLSLEVMFEDNEEPYRLIRVATPAGIGQQRNGYVLISNRAVYLVRKDGIEGNYCRELGIRYSQFDHIVSLGFVYFSRDVLSQSLGRPSSERCVVFTGQEAVSRGLVESVCTYAARCPGFLRSIPLNRDDEVRLEAIEKELIKLGSQTSMDIVRYSLVNWEQISGDPPPFVTRATKQQNYVNGWLQVKAANVLGLPVWKQAYLELRSGTLYQYSSEEDKVPKYEYLIHNCGGCTRVTGESKQFKIVLDREGTSTLFLAASNEQELTKWLQALCEAVIGSETPSSPRHRRSCLNCGLLLTQNMMHILLEDWDNDSMQLVTSCRVTDVNDVSVDRSLPLYCTVAYDHGSMQGVWLVCFHSEQELSKFEYSLRQTWEEEFQISLSPSAVTDETLRDKAHRAVELMQHSRYRSDSITRGRSEFTYSAAF